MGKVKRKKKGFIIKKRVPHLRKKEKLKLLKQFKTDRDDPFQKKKFYLSMDAKRIVLQHVRIDFFSSTNQSMPVGFGQARCHSFSQDFIAVMLHNIVELAIFRSNEIEIIYTLLMYFGEVIYGSDQLDGEGMYEETAREFCMSVSQNDLHEAVYSANGLMDQLNNARHNLRVGNQSWNASISNDFDPSAWAYVANVGGTKKYISQDGLDWQDDPYGRPEGIHLTDPNDVRRMISFRDFRTMISNDYAFGIDIYEDELDGISCCIVGSSSNAFAKPPGCRPCKCTYIYIENNGTWELL